MLRPLTSGTSCAKNAALRCSNRVIPIVKALISIGTNSTRALVAEFDPKPRVVLQRWAGTRIGEGLKESGRLQDEAMRRTLDAIEDQTSAVRALTSNVQAIATSALRRAKNAGDFVERAETLIGAKLDVISGDEEARCSYTGAICGLPEGEYGVLDVGGGSTEYAIATAHVSCEIGAVRLTEKFPSLRGVCEPGVIAEGRAAVREALRPLRPFEAQKELVAVGGSAKTAVAVVRGASSDEPYQGLERSQLHDLIDQLAILPLERRKALPGMVAQRADILLAGALILDEAFALTGHASAIVSANDLLLGYLLRR